VAESFISECLKEAPRTNSDTSSPVYFAPTWLAGFWCFTFLQHFADTDLHSDFWFGSVRGLKSSSTLLLIILFTIVNSWRTFHQSRAVPQESIIAVFHGEFKPTPNGYSLSNVKDGHLCMLILPLLISSWYSKLTLTETVSKTCWRVQHISSSLFYE
jgi:hypothetical protein